MMSPRRPIYVARIHAKLRDTTLSEKAGFDLSGASWIEADIRFRTHRRTAEPQCKRPCEQGPSKIRILGHCARKIRGRIHSLAAPCENDGVSLRPECEGSRQVSWDKHR